jgi:hypothetical protein
MQCSECYQLVVATGNIAASALDASNVNMLKYLVCFQKSVPVVDRRLGRLHELIGTLPTESPSNLKLIFFCFHS